MTERVQKLLAAAGLCSRRTAEEWIAAGRVTVNGQAAHIGDKADPETDTVAVDGRPVGRAAGHVYIMLHKPRGYVTTLSDERGRRTAAELVKDCGVRVYPVGRLDRDSEGLLLFTNDGALTQRLLHPSHQVDKVYIVSVSGADEGERRASARRDITGRTAHRTGAGGRAVPPGRQGGIPGRHPSGKEAADTPHVRRRGADRDPPVPDSRGRPEAGSAAAGTVAVSHSRRTGIYQRKRLT